MLKFTTADWYRFGRDVLAKLGAAGACSLSYYLTLNLPKPSIYSFLLVAVTPFASYWLLFALFCSLTVDNFVFGWVLSAWIVLLLDGSALLRIVAFGYYVLQVALPYLVLTTLAIFATAVYLHVRHRPEPVRPI